MRLERWEILKPDGRQRLLGITSIEDKIVQGTMCEILQNIYEVDFLGFSYGFRPGRSQHDALDVLSVTISGKRVNWILDADIEGFFDTIDHQWLIKFLEHRIGDRRVLRLIFKWLRAGISEDNDWSVTKMGTSQGAGISPLLSNIYLYYVFDLWIEFGRSASERREKRGEKRPETFDFLGFTHQCAKTRKDGRFIIHRHSIGKRM